jgi:DNA-binding NarL/FixJ family response regulator
MINRQSDLVVVGEAKNGEEAVNSARILQPDVILMDVKMPTMDGVEAAGLILADMPNTKILAFSIYADDGFMANMMHAGALGYILKGCDSEELLDAIRRTAGSGKM